MQRAQLRPEERDAGYCQLFVEKLTDAALNWFSRLKTNSIDDYDQLTTAFLKHYSIHIQQAISDADLYALRQGSKESLRSFINRFRAIVSQILISDGAALGALKHALWYDSKFKASMTTDKPATLEDAMHRATGFIELEENRAAMSKKLVSKQPITKEKAAEEYVEPSHHYDDSYQQDFKKQKTLSFQIGDREQQELDNQPWNI